MPTEVDAAPAAREGGRLARFIARATFFPTLLVWTFICRLGFQRWWDRIDDHVIVGALPSRRDLRRLHALGVGAVVNMCAEYAGNARELGALGMTQLRLPTTDYTPPSEQAILRGIAFIREQSDANRQVYVHCKAGRGRAPTMALCYLMAAYDLSPADAYERLKSSRGWISRGLDRRAVVQRIAARLRETAP